MKTTRLTGELIYPDMSDSSFPWLHLLDAVVWKLDLLKKVESSIAHSLYYSIIVDIAGILEGFINEILDIALEEKTTTSYTSEELDTMIESDDIDNEDEEKSEDFKYRLFDNLRERIQNSTWTGYHEIFKLIFGKEMQNSVGIETWKSINSLFTFRNMIIHGKTLTFNYIQIDDSDKFSISLDNKYQRVYAYLTELNLIETTVNGYVDIVNYQIVLHYYNSMNNFIKEVIDSMDNSQEKKSIVEIFSIDKKLRHLLPI